MDYWERLIQSLTDEKYEGIEFLLIRNLFAFLTMIVLIIIGLVLYGT
jgi:hypothetical protein